MTLILSNQSTLSPMAVLTKLSFTFLTSFHLHLNLKKKKKKKEKKKREPNTWDLRQLKICGIFDKWAHIINLCKIVGFLRFNFELIIIMRIGWGFQSHKICWLYLQTGDWYYSSTCSPKIWKIGKEDNLPNHLLAVISLLFLDSLDQKPNKKQANFSFINRDWLWLGPIFLGLNDFFIPIF